jgi:hypothetical protein
MNASNLSGAYETERQLTGLNRPATFANGRTGIGRLRTSPAVKWLYNRFGRLSIRVGGNRMPTALSAKKVRRSCNVLSHRTMCIGSFHRKTVAKYIYKIYKVI